MLDVVRSSICTHFFKGENLIPFKKNKFETNNDASWWEEGEDEHEEGDEKEEDEEEALLTS